MTERRQRRTRDLSSAGKIGKYVLETAVRTQPNRSLFRAYDPFLDRKVAIKIIRLFDPDSEQLGDYNDAFFSEAKAIGQLQHQNIVSVYDAGVGDYEGFIVMEFIEGESLLERLNSQKKLPIKQALLICLQICQALDYAGTKGVVHRDIKPSNIMLTRDDKVKVVDFGISVLGKHTTEKKSTLVGTPAYIAPELVHGASANITTDLYSLSVLLYEMILGRLPYPSGDAHAVLYKVINEEVEGITEDIPQSIKKFILCALSKDPKQRISSCVEFEEKLSALLDAIDKPQFETELDTAELNKLQIFGQCSPEVLHELATCLEFEKVLPGDIIISEEFIDEYICLVQGKALLVSTDKHIIVPVGKWLNEIALQQKLTTYSCKALTSSLVVRVSRSNILETSQTTQAYFFRFILEHIFIP